MAEQSHIPNLDGLVELGNRDGVDIRPTLLRVTTDLYVAKDRHSSAEERHYTELALRLIDLVDAPTREIVARRLANYPGAPAAVVQRLARNANHEVTQAETPMAAKPMGTAAAPTAAARTPAMQSPAAKAPVPPAPTFRTAAHELNALFFTADAAERRLILLNLGYAVWQPAPPIAPEVALEATRRLETAALGHSTRAFAQELERTLAISNAQARRLIDDPSGEALVIVARALAMPAAVLQRILLCLNPAIGQSVERVYDLVQLYEELDAQPAMHMLALWRAVSMAAKPAQRPAAPAPQPRSQRPPEADTRAPAPLQVTRPRLPWNELTPTKAEGA
jgi:hypothetical protein